MDLVVAGAVPLGGLLSAGVGSFFLFWLLSGRVARGILRIAPQKQ